MIYVCADDYGLCDEASQHIEECIAKGAINKVSVFPNIGTPDISKITGKNLTLSLHLNLVEGRCMAKAEELSLLTNKDGNFTNTFTGLFKLNLFNKKELEKQLYTEIKAQVNFWKNLLPKGEAFGIDSHQHTHMVPAVFSTLLKVLAEEEIDVKYLRVPKEPVLPFVLTPSLWFTYSAANLIKQWLINFLWLINKRKAKKYNYPTALFMGILFSGKMDEKRVGKILPKYIKLAKKQKKDIEVLFHPGYLEEKPSFNNKNIVFEKFHLSKNRKTEHRSVINLAERGDFNAIH